jgi:phosphate-selective porin OprO/OprP
MGYGQLFDTANGVNRIHYAAGGFNGNRDGYAANQDGKFLSAYLNFHRFGTMEGSLLENFNFGGSLFTGNNAQAPVPSPTLRTVQAATGNALFGIPFLTYSDKAMLSGPMAFWDMHLAWFYLIRNECYSTSKSEIAWRLGREKRLPANWMLPYLD